MIKSPSLSNKYAVPDVARLNIMIEMGEIVIR
jgi:hypothetical protein